MSAPRFVTFEGIDGAGKSTHVAWFAQALRDAGQRVVLSREPGGTGLAEKLRDLVLTQDMPGQAELLLVFAARADHLHTVIRPALADGAWVVCDRFTDSTYAYQGAGRSLDTKQIGALEQWVVGADTPARTYFFDLNPRIAAARRLAAREPDRFEAEQVQFFERVRSGYLAQLDAQPERMVRIDASASVDQIRTLLAADLQTLLNATTADS